MGPQSDFSASGTPVASDPLDPDTINAAQAKGGILSDIGHGLKIGADIAAQDVRELVSRVPVIGKSIVAALDKVDEWTHAGASSDALLKSDITAQTALESPEQQAAGNKRWDTLGPDSAWRDPRSYAGGLAQSLPEQAVMIFPAMRLAKGAYAASLVRSIAADAEAGIVGSAARVAAEEAAGKVAANTATIAGSAIEGPLGGAQSSRQVRDDILALTREQLNDSAAMQSLMAGPTGLDFNEARAKLAEDASTKAFFLSGVATGIFGGMGDRMLAKAMAGQLKAGILSRLVRAPEGGIVSRGIEGAAVEGRQEFLQGGAQQMAQNVAMQAAVPDTPVMQDVAHQALGGMALGVLQGGGSAAAFGHGATSPKQILAQPDVDSVIAAFKFDVSNNNPEPIDFKALARTYRDHTPNEVAENQSILEKAFRNDPAFAPDADGAPTIYGAPLRAVAPQDLAPHSDNPEGLSRAQYEAVSALNTASGLRTVVYADSDSLPDGAVNANATPGVVFLSDRSSVDPAVVAAHEVEHLARDGDKQAEFVRVVNEELTADALDIAHQRHDTKDAEGNVVPMSDPKLLEEIRADIHGDAIADPAFFGRVIDHMALQLGDKAAESHATTFLKSIASLIQRVRAVLTGTTFTRPDGARIATSYVKNLERAHEALAAAIADRFITEGYRPPGGDTNTNRLLVQRTLDLQRQKAAWKDDPALTYEQNKAKRAIMDRVPYPVAPPGSSAGLNSALDAAQKAPVDRTHEERINLEAVKVGVRMSPKPVERVTQTGDDVTIRLTPTERSYFTQTFASKAGHADLIDQVPSATYTAGALTLKASEMPALADYAGTTATVERGEGRSRLPPSFTAATLPAPVPEVQMSPKRSEMSRIAAMRTRTPEFRKWFSGSRVVDAKGAPLTVYHGTGQDFETPSGNLWATDAPTTAETYAEFAMGGAPAIIPAHMALTNPLVVDADGVDRNNISFRGGKHDTDYIADVAKKEGFDGVIIRNVFDDFDSSAGMATSYVAFNPAQVKSVFNPRPTSNPSMSLSPKSEAAKIEAARAVSTGVAITKSPGFKAWFGRSVITTTGRAGDPPQKYYHGTARDISTFQPKQAGAIFLTSDPQFAEGFSHSSESWKEKHGIYDDVGQNVMPVYVKSENPFDYENPKQVNALIKLAKDNNAPIADMEIIGLREGYWGVLEFPEIQALIRETGYDGFYVSENDRKNLAVYDPAQVKSAIGNTGAFDARNPDIRFSPKTVDQISSEFEARTEAFFRAAKVGPVKLSDDTPAALQMFGWTNRAVMVEPKVMRKMKDDHNLTTAQFGKMPAMLMRPMFIFADSKNGSLNFFGTDFTEGKPGMLAVKPERQTDSESGPQQTNMVVTGYEPSNGWDEVTKRIMRGELVYRDISKPIPAAVWSVLAAAQKKFAQSGRVLPRELLQGRASRSVLERSYNVLGASDLVKWESDNANETARYAEAQGADQAETENARDDGEVTRRPPKQKGHDLVGVIFR